MMIACAFLAIGMHGYREYRETGGLSATYFVVSGITLTAVVSIMAIMSWWGNRPGPEDRPK